MYISLFLFSTFCEHQCSMDLLRSLWLTLNTYPWRLSHLVQTAFSLMDRKTCVVKELCRVRYCVTGEDIKESQSAYSVEEMVCVHVLLLCPKVSVDNS